MPPTRAKDIKPRQRDVTLADLKTDGDQPVIVTVFPIQETDLLRITEHIVAANPVVGPQEKTDEIEAARAALKYAEPIIELCVALEGEDGKLQRGALPMAWLSDRDKLLLFDAIMEVSGLTRRLAEAATFPDHDAGGLERGGGAVGDLPLPAEPDPATTRVSAADALGGTLPRRFDETGGEGVGVSAEGESDAARG